MYLAPDGDEIEIADAAAAFLAEAMPIDRLHVASGAGGGDLADDLRRSLGQMGWFALALPEAAGGSGLSAVDHALFFREVGRHCGPIDVLAQMLAVLACDNDELRAAMIAGDTGVALAVADGARMRLLGAADASHALVVGGDMIGLVALDGIAAEQRNSLDPAIPMRLADFTMPATAANAVTIRRLGALGVAAMLIGIAEATLAQIVDYAQVRETFGRKIGSWQAVRHPCADMAVRLEAARSQLWFAAAALKEERGDAEVHLDAAKHLANQAAVANADANIQLHGGIGVTEEHHAHLYLKHALVLTKLFGTKRTLLARLLDAQVED